MANARPKPPPAPAPAVDAAGEFPAPAAQPPPAALAPAGYVVATARLHTSSGGLAHVPGDRVPAGNVARNGWAGLVRPAGDEAADGR